MRLPEDPAERADFDRVCKLLDQTPLERIAQTLGIWSQMAPQNGSYAKLCAIMANECAKAAPPPGGREGGE